MIIYHALTGALTEQKKKKSSTFGAVKQTRREHERIKGKQDMKVMPGQQTLKQQGSEFFKNPTHEGQTQVTHMSQCAQR